MRFQVCSEDGTKYNYPVQLFVDNFLVCAYAHSDGRKFMSIAFPYLDKDIHHRTFLQAKEAVTTNPDVILVSNFTKN